MPTYLNPGNAKFQKTLASQIYVDKTEMILCLNSLVNTEQCYVSISRPRRFGKSIAANMIASYYGIGDSRNLFETTRLARHDSWDSYLNQFDVIRVVMTDFIKSDKDVKSSLERMQKLIVRDLKKQYPDVDYYDSSDLIQSLLDIYEEEGKQFVIIIDEWDAVFRVRKDDTTGQKMYLDFLHDWFKDKEYIALAYMTGILPIKKYGQHSALNMFDEYSVITPMQFARYTGFTEEEVRKLCKDYGRSFDQIKDWYDGYDVSDLIPPDPNYELHNTTGKELKACHYDIYSPLSVVKAITTGVIQNYWNKTETYEALADYIQLNYDGLKNTIVLLMDGGRTGINISKYQNDMTSFHGKDDVLTLLIHLGYLGYDTDTKEVFIPNHEILDEFRNSTDTFDWTDSFSSFRKSKELLRATWNQDEERVASILEYFHDMAENRSYNSEAALSYAIQMAYYAAQKYYTTIQEMDTGKGYADLVLIPSPRHPDKPALLIELKYNKTTEEAEEQIIDRRYQQRLDHYKGNTLIVSINYNKTVSGKDKRFKHHTCLIKKV